MSLCITSSLALKSDDNNVIIQVQNHLHVKLAAHLQQSNITRSRGTSFISLRHICDSFGFNRSYNFVA